MLEPQRCCVDFEARVAVAALERQTQGQRYSPLQTLTIKKVTLKATPGLPGVIRGEQIAPKTLNQAVCRQVLRRRRPNFAQPGAATANGEATRQRLDAVGAEQPSPRDPQAGDVKPGLAGRWARADGVWRRSLLPLP